MKEFYSQYAAILLGTFIGGMAHFGRKISDEGWPTPRYVIGFLMQLGLVALIAAMATEQFVITSDIMRSATSAILAVAANEVLRWAYSKASKILEMLGAGPHKPSGD